MKQLSGKFHEHCEKKKKNYSDGKASREKIIFSLGSFYCLLLKIRWVWLRKPLRVVFTLHK